MLYLKRGRGEYYRGIEILKGGLCDHEGWSSSDDDSVDKILFPASTRTLSRKS